MRKEILLAIIVGIAAGLGITYAMYSLRLRLASNTTADTILESRLMAATPTPGPMTMLTIQQPEQDTLSTQATIQIIGRSIPNANIVVLAQETEVITTADQDGDFALTVPLIAGGNRLTILSISPDGQEESEVRNVVYSTADLNASPAEGTSSAEVETEAESE